MGTKKKIAKLKSDLKRNNKLVKRLAKVNAKLAKKADDLGIFANKKR